jgi:hypothetical protein
MIVSNNNYSLVVIDDSSGNAGVIMRIDSEYVSSTLVNALVFGRVQIFGISGDTLHEGILNILPEKQLLIGTNIYGDTAGIVISIDDGLTRLLGDINVKDSPSPGGHKVLTRDTVTGDIHQDDFPALDTIWQHYLGMDSVIFWDAPHSKFYFFSNPHNAVLATPERMILIADSNRRTISMSKIGGIVISANNSSGAHISDDDVSLNTHGNVVLLRGFDDTTAYNNVVLDSTGIYLVHNPDSNGTRIRMEDTTIALDGINTSFILFPNDIGVTGHLIPTQDSTYDLGTPILRWRDLYVSNGSIHIGDQRISIDDVKRWKRQDRINIFLIIIASMMSGIAGALISRRI